jgi:hypothetical protein
MQESKMGIMLVRHRIVNRIHKKDIKGICLEEIEHRDIYRNYA